MGRRSRMKRERRRRAAQQQQQADAPLDDAWPSDAEAIAWTDEQGLHTLMPGDKPTPEQLDEMSRTYQEKIRSSPLWQEMVATSSAPKRPKPCSKTFASSSVRLERCRP